jgi:hypothetical protein
MSEFKFVQWGKNVPVDYQRLNAMMINEQYLKDIADNAPKGVLAWKTSDSDTSTTVIATPTSFAGIGSVSFNTEANRMIKISLFIWTLNNAVTDITITTTPNITYSGANAVTLDFDIDGTLVGNDGGGVQRIYTDIDLASANPTEIITATYFTQIALTAGSHTVTPKIMSYPYLATAKAQVRLLVEDIGAFISES